jgi:glycosyltransferase involved in cell wall biosynthesis
MATYHDAVENVLATASENVGGRSKILYISSSSPVPAKLGPARRNFHILEQLCRYYDVTHLSLGSRSDQQMFAHEFGERVPDHTFVSPRGGQRSKAARKIWRTLTGRCDFSPVLEKRLHDACGRLATYQSFDAIVLSCVLLRSLPLPRQTPIIGDTHNVEFDVHRQIASNATALTRRLYSRLQWRATRRAERRCAGAVDLLLATSEHDRGVFQRELQLRDVRLVPNGIDLREFRPPEKAAEPDVILFTGLMSYYPNQQAVRWFLDSIFPSILRRCPGARFVVGGAAPPPWLLARRTHNVEVTGAVPDMRPHLARASVVVVPLLIGGGTRVKILEASAMNRVVVSTSLGAQGLGMAPDRDVLIADDAESFAERVVRSLDDPVGAARMARAAREHVERHFDWDRIGDGLARILDDRLQLVSCVRSPRAVAPLLPW